MENLKQVSGEIKAQLRRPKLSWELCPAEPM